MAQYRTEVQQTGCSQLTCQPTNLAALPSFAANLLLGFEILCGDGEALAQTDQKSCGSPFPGVVQSQSGCGSELPG